MNDATARIVDVLRAAGQTLDVGLAEGELVDLERAYAFRFPPDLRDLLAAVHPVGGGWPDWRRRVVTWANGEHPLEEQFGWIIHGTVFDIEHNNFWWDGWGARPKSLAEAIEVATRSMEKAPKLVPVWGHRFIPSDPPTRGHPVLSIMQTDIVIYGEDLLDYVCHEFKQPRPTREPNESATSLPYWGGFLAAAWDARYGTD